jgi:hypothetical protein
MPPITSAFLFRRLARCGHPRRDTVFRSELRNSLPNALCSGPSPLRIAFLAPVLLGRRPSVVGSRPVVECLRDALTRIGVPSITSRRFGRSWRYYCRQLSLSKLPKPLRAHPSRQRTGVLRINLDAHRYGLAPSLAHSGDRSSCVRTLSWCVSGESGVCDCQLHYHDTSVSLGHLSRWRVKVQRSEAA